MKPAFDPKAIRKVHGWEYLVRFFFGGAVTVATGLVARRCGPMVGGCFLAFPAILPATLTLVKEHDGRARADEDARGAVLGAGGLAAFAAVASWLAPAWHAVPTLMGATLAWLAVSIALWVLVYGRRRTQTPRRAPRPRGRRVPVREVS